MLEPAGRVLYLEQLRPPDGYRLDCAVATTYSLDLVSLLMAPMSMALMEVDEPQETLEDPVALLEALRRTTGRFSIFCQQGRISIPRTESLLYGYLESSVVEVQPPHEHAVFHPKIWLLRFTDEDENILYRFLCLSRNLTNDRSWDTAVVLDGELAGQGETFPRNRPLSEFVSALPGLSVQEPANNTVETCDLISDEIRRVDFEVPDPFRDEGEPEDLMFAPMGLPEVTGPSPRHEGSNRHLVVSPFLSAGKIREIAEHGSDNVLISRSDELEGLNQSTCKDIEGMDTDLYVLGEGADHPDEVTGQRGGRSDVEEESDEVKDVSRRLSGLHAKLYLIEHGAYDVRLWSGSANATNAGLGGRNVELLVGLRGWRREMGIDKVLGEESDQEKKEVTCLRDLLRRYAPSEQEKTEDEATREVERELQNARRKIACADLEILASRSDESYELTLRATEPLSLEEDEVSGICFLVSQGEDAARNLDQLLSGDCVRFENVSGADVTRFVAFRLTARSEGEEGSVGFVLNCPAKGFPENRDEKILSTLLSDQESFLRYLLFLLADEDSPDAIDGIMETMTAGSNPDTPFHSIFDDMPLFEQMVRAYSRCPEKIERVADLVRDLEESRPDEQVVPQEFYTVWGVFEELLEEERT